jgi:hypothetical protein
MNRRLGLIELLILLGSAALPVTVRADGEKGPAKSEIDINRVMLAAHVRDIEGKGNRGTKRNLDTRVLSGQATQREQARLLELYRQLEQATPPRGSPGEWRRLTTPLVEAMDGVTTGREGAREQLARALNCQTCHDRFRVHFWPGLSNLTDPNLHDFLAQSKVWTKETLPPRYLVERAGKVKGAGGSPTIEQIATGPDGWCLLVDFRDPCSDDALRALTSTKKLCEIRILAGGVTDTGLGYLKDLPDLKVLVVSTKELTDKGLESIGALPALTQLDIARTRVSEKGLAALADLTNLKELYLAGADVRDEDVGPLKTLTHLEWLSVPPSVSKAKHEELQRALPKTRVLRDAGK